MREKKASETPNLYKPAHTLRRTPRTGEQGSGVSENHMAPLPRLVYGQYTEAVGFRSGSPE